MKRRPVYVCLGDVDPAVPWADLGYAQYHERSARYYRAGKRQRQCPTCGLWR